MSRIGEFKLKISTSEKEFDLICGEFRSLDTINHDHSRNHNTLNLRHESVAQESLDFEPSEIQIEGYSLGSNIEDFKSFLRYQNEKFRIDIEHQGKKLFAYCKLANDSVRVINALNGQVYAFSLIRLSMYFREKIYNADIAEATSQDGYELQYTYQYSDQGNTFESSQILVYNEGEADAPLQMELYCDELDPQVGVNIRADFTINSYRADGVNPDSQEIIINSSLPDTFRIVKDVFGVETRIDQYRKWAGSRGYLYVPKGENTLYFNNVVKARVVLYECYYNI